MSTGVIITVAALGWVAAAVTVEKLGVPGDVAWPATFALTAGVVIWAVVAGSR